ncbi:cytochrome P450 7A1 isoform X2 [Boleophthalmus pectinirostris]|nr:cytochrome P450 7A1 isoform X2 [Boleophthalmus pectinirostris]
MTFIMNPLHFPVIVKHGRYMDFHEFTNVVSAHAFGYTPVTAERFPGVMDQINNTFKLLQGPHLPHLTENMTRNLLLVFREEHLSRGQSPEWKISHLHDFCLTVALEVGFMTLYGRSPSDHRLKDLQNIKQDFLCFDQKFPLLMAKVPLWLLGDVRSARQRLIERFSSSVMSDSSDLSLFVQRRRLLFHQHGISDHDAAGQHWALFWASVGNTSPSMFWCLFHLLRHQEALRAVRAELQELMSQEGLRPDPDLVLTEEQLDRLVVLGSVLSESLRLSSMSLNVRVVLEDFSLRLDQTSTWSIRKGDMITMCPHSAQLDPEIYPEPKSFQFDRYLDDGKEKLDFYKSGQRLKYHLMPFGSGATMCPGRFLALHQIKQFVCLLLLHLDVELCDPDADVPLDLSRAGLGIMHPAHDVRFRYRPRRPLQADAETAAETTARTTART